MAWLKATAFKSIKNLLRYYGKPTERTHAHEIGFSEETNNSVFEYYSNNIRIITIRIRIRPFFQNE